MINILKMILEIKERPILYNTSHILYRDSEAKKNAWEELTKILIDDYGEISDQTKYEKVELIKRKWKSVSDYYKKERKLLAQGQKIRRRSSKYAFADALSFLNPYIDCEGQPKEKRVRSTKVTRDSYDSNEFLEQDETFQEDDVEQLEEDYLELDPEPQPPPKKIKTTEEMYDPLLSVEHAQTSDMTLANSEDSDKLFLLSFLSDMQAMSDMQKIEFKIQMLHTLRKIKYGHNSNTQVNSREQDRLSKTREHNVPTLSKIDSDY